MEQHEVKAFYDKDEESEDEDYERWPSVIDECRCGCLHCCGNEYDSEYNRQDDAESGGFFPSFNCTVLHCLRKKCGAPLTRASPTCVKRQ